ncbi:MAG TPA: DUF815 domain-containing protein [Aquifex aeolicus]|uniref:DUF815 domain-containing protein n=1 Tax=Aquifex aeolicus TaxID=63363 RepID=A0A9D0YNC2_AQUAO|nr:DUF815 domain-containing protein [Aquificales bacterium]HIP86675.1 DUF815 domain-containing protein [Aquifex sp.]HIP97956.1 DUF815 domain-containing protein [Aquifex aeolicus]HIQ26333.1 DUF815 domain-containing protein [Aquifex aeolicus]
MKLLELFKNHRAVAVLNGKPIGVKRVNIPPLEDFVGVERQRKLLVKNTLSFLGERPFNDVLLWGKRGTGKSSLVRATLNLSSRLRLLQVDKEDVGFLIEFFNFAWELPEFKFIVLVDDLSVLTEEGKTIRILKTLLDGSVFERPPNVAIYATSNRRNLTPETYLERDFKFPREELEERLSLVDRFGLKIGFTDFSPSDYLSAVKLYCKKLKISFDEELKEKALAYAREKDFSGRSAYQFVRLYASLQTHSP